MVIEVGITDTHTWGFGAENGQEGWGVTITHNDRQYRVIPYGQAEHWEEVMTDNEVEGNVQDETQEADPQPERDPNVRDFPVEGWMKVRGLYNRHWPHVATNYGAWYPIPNYDPATHGSNPEVLLVSPAELDEIRAYFTDKGLLV